MPIKLRCINGELALIILAASSLTAIATASAAGKKVLGAAKYSQGAGDAGTAKRIIRRTLIDPQSAQFTTLSVKRADDRIGAKTNLFCGSYNAKNRFGGYVGAAYFAYPVSEKAVFTSSIARLNLDGTSVSAAELRESLSRASMPDIAANQGKFSALLHDVEFWLHQCPF